MHAFHGMLQKGNTALANEGFRGMGIKGGLTYHFSLWAKSVEGSSKLRDRVGGFEEWCDRKNDTVWKLHLSGKNMRSIFRLQPLMRKSSLRMTFEGKGVLDADMISLFPDDTWKKRPGGLRADLVQLLADMKPGFLRFPGGCIVEGRELVNRYQWKKTIGKVEDRELIVNRWNSEFKHRPAPDYYQTFGLGFF